jgi:hypothetical protein
MPKFSSVDVLFTRTPDGWTFNSSYPRIFGRPWRYLLTEAQKETLEKRLNRLTLMVHVGVWVMIALGTFALIVVRDFANQLFAGLLEAWLLAGIVWIALWGALIPAVLFVRYRVVQPTLHAARCVGPVQPDWLGFVILKEMIKRYTERKSAKALIIWIALGFLCSAYGTIVYALAVSARIALILFGIVVTWSATLWYAALLVLKLRGCRRNGG